MMSYTRLSKCS